ncbi:hypothetical protein G7059_00085 [Erysipelothrix sp. HDW6A]|uniref:conjugal transfer protein TrbL family protein n=1 Tax=Erysipelothrix sp. HDW6A TaxID=2714928 RepID=UPI00140B2BF3|nr:conjugal transfer protein TrbL family protein [Erysipelothrix sp. HDW6A]QIK56353.1 hypothetical protein G7059_00085 [Erysipelothrix sp. HDW6A]
MKLITDVIRMFIWGIVWAVLQLSDWVYGISMNVASLDVGNFSTLWQWWGALSMLIGSFATLRMLILVFKYFYDTEYQDKIDVIKILTRVLMVSLAIAFMPYGVKTLTAAGSAAVTNMGTTFGFKGNHVPSTIIISSLLDEKAETIVNGETVTIMKEYKLSDVDINTSGEGDKDYKFFNSMGDLFIALIMGGVAAVFILLIGVDVGKRIFSIAMLVLISPLPISALINPDDTSFTRWQKLVLSNVLSNFVQVLLLNFVLVASSSPWLRSQGAFAAIIAFIGGLFAILGGVSEISSIIGGETGTQGTLQQLATLRQATRGMGGRGGGKGGAIGRGLSNAATLAGAAVGYGTGRLLGGESMGSMNSQNSINNSSSKQGFKGNEARKNGNNSRMFSNASNIDGSSSQFNDSNKQMSGYEFGDSQSDATMQSQSSNEFSGGRDERHQENRNDAFTDGSSSTNRENIDVKDLGNEAQGNANRPQGEGMKQEKSFSSAEARSNAETTQGLNMNQQAQGKAQFTSASQSDSLKGQSEKAQSNNFQQERTNAQSTQQQSHAGSQGSQSQRFSRQGSFADRYAQKAYSTKGSKFARVASNSGRHVYQSSVNRLQRSMPARTARALKNLASVPEDYQQGGE